MTLPVLVSIQTGQPQSLEYPDPRDGRDRRWRTAFHKGEAAGPLWLGPLGLFGDAQADRQHHGGPDRAVLAYSADHYPLWHQELGRTDFRAGAFGENFTIAGLDETTVCLGDVYAVGDARVQVSQPRVPCYKIARRWSMPDLTARVERTGRTGWYLRVLDEASIEAGLPVTLLERPNPTWPVTRVAQVFRRRAHPSPETAELATLSHLAADWRSALGVQES